MERLGKFAILMTIAIGAAFFKGYVLSVVWGWFIVPLGMVEISAVHGAGLILAYDAISGLSLSDLAVAEKKKGAEKIASMVTTGYLAPTIILGVAWFFSLLM